MSRTVRPAAFKKLSEAVSRGERVPTGLYFTSGGHKVLVDRISVGRVHFTNPWGQEESLAIDEFKQRLKNLHVRQ